MTTCPVLETERLILRAHTLDDHESYCAMWQDAEVLRYTIREPRSPQDAWLTLQRTAGSWVLLGYGFWAVEWRETGEFIGEAGFMNALRPFATEMHDTPELGYGFRPAWWGRGVASEALTAAHGWYDAAFPGQMSFAIIDDDNPSSIRAAEKQGYMLDRHVESGFGRPGLYLRAA